MANPEHLARIKQGVSIWNNWRNENPELRPDLGGSDLRELNLRGAQLSLVYLVRSKS